MSGPGIYLDHNATTPLRPEVWEAMQRVERGATPLRNPSSAHTAGLNARRALDDARERVAELLDAAPQEVVFTGGGSEAINFALKGTVWASGRAHPHVIATAVEHPATLQALAWLQAGGAQVSLLPVDAYGRVSPAAVEQALRPQTVLVSVMHVNNEVGVIEPVEEIARLCEKRGVALHVDAVQSVGKLSVRFSASGCTLLSCAAHKLGGPRGVGALLVREGARLTPLVHGGHQEGGLRAGTENVAGAVGFAEALALALDEREAVWARWLELRLGLLTLERDLNAVRVNSAPDLTVPNCVNLSFMYCDGMALATNLSAHGVYVSTGSACCAGSLTPSHVLKAMGLSDEAAHGALRLSMGRETTAAEVEETVRVTCEQVARMRELLGPGDIGKCGKDCACFLAQPLRRAGRRNVPRRAAELVRARKDLPHQDASRH
jgi:cysteine desulfurase